MGPDDAFGPSGLPFGPQTPPGSSSRAARRAWRRHRGTIAIAAVTSFALLSVAVVAVVSGAGDRSGTVLDQGALDEQAGDETIAPDTTADVDAAADDDDAEYDDGSDPDDQLDITTPDADPEDSDTTDTPDPTDSNTETDTTDTDTGTTNTGTTNTGTTNTGTTTTTTEPVPPPDLSRWVDDPKATVIDLAGEPIPAPGPPSISSMSETSGIAGDPVALTGTNFAGTTSVAFNGRAAESFIIASPTQIVVTVPVGATAGPITVSSASGTAVSAVSFTPTSPVINGLSSASGAAGATITISGTNLGATTIVRFNGVEVAPATVAAGSVTAVVPTGATTGKVSVVTPTGIAISTNDLTITSTAISDFAPALGVPGTVVTITGGNFTGTTSVKLNGVEMVYTVRSATQLTATVPSNATSGTIVVVSPAGTATSVKFFSVGPRISSFSPTTVDPGDVLTITGANLGATVSVSFTGASSTVQSVTIDSASSIRVPVPSDAATGAFTVYAAGTTVSASSLAVRAVISELVPTSAPKLSKVQIVGAGFKGVSAVKIGTLTLATSSYTVVSPTVIELTVPGAAVTGTVSVTTSAGTVTSSTSLTVTDSVVLLPPAAPLVVPGSSAAPTNVPAALSSVTPASLEMTTSVDLGVTQLSGLTGSVNAGVYTGSATARVGRFSFAADVSYTSSVQWTVTATGTGSFTVGDTSFSVTTLGGSINAAAGTTTWTLAGRLAASVPIVPSKVTILGALVSVGVACPEIASAALCTPGPYLRLDADPPEAAAAPAIATGLSVTLGGPVPAQAAILFHAALNLSSGAFNLTATFPNTAVVDLVVSGVGPSMKDVTLRVARGDATYARMSGPIVVAAGTANNGFDVQLTGAGTVKAPRIFSWNAPSMQAQLVDGGLVVVGSVRTTSIGDAAMSAFAYFDAQPSTTAEVLGVRTIVPAKTMMLTGSMDTPSWLRTSLGLPRASLGAYATLIGDSVTLAGVIPTGVKLPKIPYVEATFDRALVVVEMDWKTTTLPNPMALKLVADGTVTVSGNQPINASLEARVNVSGGVSVGLTVAGIDGRMAWPDVFGIDGFDLETFSVSLGFTAAPPSVSIGLAGKGRLPGALTDSLGTSSAAPIQFIANLSASTPCLEIDLGSPGNTVPALSLPPGVGAMTATYLSLRASVRGCTVGAFEVPTGVQIGGDAKILGTNLRFFGRYSPTTGGYLKAPTLQGWASLNGMSNGGNIKWDARFAYGSSGYVPPNFQIRGGVTIGSNGRIAIEGNCVSLAGNPVCNASGVGGVAIGGVSLDVKIGVKYLFTPIVEYWGSGTVKFAGVRLGLKGKWYSVAGYPLALAFDFEARASFPRGVIDELRLRIKSDASTFFFPSVRGRVSGNLGGVFKSVTSGAGRFSASGAINPGMRRIKFDATDIKLDLGLIVLNADMGFDMCLTSSCLGKVNASFSVNTVNRIDFTGNDKPFNLADWRFNTSTSSSYYRCARTGDSWGGLRGCFSGSGRIVLSSSPSFGFTASASVSAYVGLGGKWNYLGTYGASISSSGVACLSYSKYEICV
jgi:hypothetical protein